MCEDPAHRNRIDEQNYNEILKLFEIVNLDPTVDGDQRKSFREQFFGEISQVASEVHFKVDGVLKKYYRVLFLFLTKESPKRIQGKYES